MYYFYLSIINQFLIYYYINMTKHEKNLKFLNNKISNILKSKNYNNEVIENCINTIKHIYNILKAYTNKTNSEIINECNDGLIYYMEFIKQLKDNNNNNINFSYIDINIFIYKKILSNIKIVE